MAEISNPEVAHTDRKEAYLRERWVLTSAEAWERPSATAASHWSLAVLRCDHWLRTLRCAADLHSLSDDEDDGDGEAAAGWGGRVGVAAEVSIDSKGFCVALSVGLPPGSTSIRLKLAKAARLELVSNRLASCKQNEGAIRLEALLLLEFGMQRTK